MAPIHNLLPETQQILNGIVVRWVDDDEFILRDSNSQALISVDFDNNFLAFQPGESISILGQFDRDDDGPDDFDAVQVTRANGMVLLEQPHIPSQPNVPLNGSDLNGDGNPDILLRNTRTGSNVIWNMRNTSILGGGEFSVLSTDWRLAATGDFDHDNNGDIFWRNQNTGENVIWRMNNAQGIVGAITVPTLGTEWELATTGDFNSDGEEDLFWRHKNTGTNVVWYLDDGVLVGGKEVLSLSTDWSLEASGDFNSDNNEDLIWRNTLDGYASVWYSDGNSNIVGGETIAQFQDLNWRFQGSADMNRDGQSDLLLRNFGDGTNVLWTMSGSRITSGSAFSVLPDTGWEMVI